MPRAARWSRFTTSATRAGRGSGVVHIWDVTGPIRDDDLSDSDSVSHGEFAPVATIRAPTRHPAALDALGDQLVIVVGQQTMMLWNLTDPSAPVQGLVLTRDNDDEPAAVRFGPDGRTVVVKTVDTTTSVVSLDVEDAVARLCRTVQVPVTESQWYQYLPSYPYRAVCGDQ